MQRRAVADVADPDFPGEFEIALPELVVFRRFHLVAAPPAVVDRGITALDSRREHETGPVFIPLWSRSASAAPNGQIGLAIRGIADRTTINRTDCEAEQS